MIYCHIVKCIIRLLEICLNQTGNAALFIFNVAHSRKRRIFLLLYQWKYKIFNVFKYFCSTY